MDKLYIISNNKIINVIENPQQKDIPTPNNRFGIQAVVVVSTCDKCHKSYWSPDGWWNWYKDNNFDIVYKILPDDIQDTTWHSPQLKDGTYANYCEHCFSMYDDEELNVAEW